MNFKEIFDRIKEDFKNGIYDDRVRERLFTPSDPSRLILQSKHMKALPLTAGSKPEAITSQYIKKLFNQIGIEDDYIVPQVRLKSILFSGKIFNRYPDFGIFNRGEGKSLLFEVESLNKSLDKEGDKEGIEQAQEWFHDIIGLEQEYNAIVTNFNEWYFLKHEKGMMKPILKSPEEILEIIRDVAVGKERSYVEEERGETITKEFYNQFSFKLGKLLDKDDKSIIIDNLIRVEGITDEQFDQMKITYYRTIFFRMLFIKILLDWKLLPFDPIQEIFDKEKERNYFNCVKDLFFSVLNKDGERHDVLERFKELPYLNGGLFRLSDIESQNPNISLNSAGIKEIWDLLRKYDFTVSEDNNHKESSNSINPSILGYIFEKSIGDIRKETGIYYTRSLITNYISRNTLEPFLIDKINQKFKDVIPWELKSLREFRMYNLSIRSEIYEFMMKTMMNLKICDPAVGSGAFLVSIATLILEYYTLFIRSMGLEELAYQSSIRIENDKRPFKDLTTLKMHIVQNNLYGVDLNSSAIDICELRLWLWIVQPPSNLDTFDVQLAPLPNIEYNIRQGNSLFGYTKGIRSIGILDKKTKQEVKFAVLSEWIGKEKESLTQMLIERNNKINSYYHNSDANQKDQLRNEIKELTLKYNENFDQLLLQEYQDLKIIGKKVVIGYNDLPNTNFNDIFSILIRLREGIHIDVSGDQIVELRKDDKNHDIKGLTFRTNSISISYRVFVPNEQDDFLAQNPRDICNKIIAFLGSNNVKELELQYLVSLEEIKMVNPFHWSMEFSDFFNTRGFDIIIANPPYGNILSPVEKSLLLGEITEDIYLNFLFKLSRFDLPFQYAGILVPKSYLLRQKYLELRSVLLSKLGIYEITDIGSKQFPRATNEVQIIFFNRNKNYTNKLRIKDLFDGQLRIEYDLGENANEAMALDTLRICQNPACPFYDGNASFYYYTFKETCPKCKNKTNPLNRIRIKLTENILPIINKIEKVRDLNFLNPKDYPKMIRGEEDAGLKKVREKLEDNIDNNCFFVSARDDFSYYFLMKKTSFDIKSIPSDDLKGNNYEYYINPKLLIKHNSIVPATIYTEENVCFTSSIYSLLHDDINMLKFLSAIYNSLLIQFYCYFGINNQKDTTINLNQYMIRHLPIKRPNNTMISNIARRVDQVTALISESNGEITQDLQVQLKELDDIVFEMYGINEQEKVIIISLLSPLIPFFSRIYR